MIVNAREFETAHRGCFVVKDAKVVRAATPHDFIEKTDAEGKTTFSAVKDVDVRVPRQFAVGSIGGYTQMPRDLDGDMIVVVVDGDKVAAYSV